MARRRILKSATFDDLPKRLQWRQHDSRERRIQRSWWLEKNGLTTVDYLGWVSARLGPRLPSRRKLMSPEQLAAFDAEREGEGEPPW